MSILKPCPFCGSEDVKIIEHIFKGVKNTYGAKCFSCKAQSDQFFEDGINAIEAWNRRAEL